MKAPWADLRSPLAFRATVIASLALLLVGSNAVIAQEGGRFAPDPATFKPRDQKRELAMKIPGSFTLASVGDIIQMQPFSKLEQIRIVEMVTILGITVQGLREVLGELFLFCTVKKVLRHPCRRPSSPG